MASSGDSDERTVVVMPAVSLSSLFINVAGGGRGEALKLFGTRARSYIGIDISENMLQSTLKTHDHPHAIFVQMYPRVHSFSKRSPAS